MVKLLEQGKVELLTFCRGLARRAGAVALGRYGGADPALPFDQDLVTSVDLAVGDHIRDEVRGRYPNHRFLGEAGREGGRRDGRRPARDKREAKAGPRDEVSAEEADLLWLVDALDGVAMFSRGLPTWGVSIAVLFEGRPIIGVVHLPVTGELYSAAAGGQALLNDQPIAARRAPLDNEAVLLTYARFHQDYRTNFPGKVRSLGSTAAHICYVARGSADAALLGNVQVWDLAAAQVILEAAGGEIRSLEGQPFKALDYLEETRIEPHLIAGPRGAAGELATYLHRG